VDTESDWVAELGFVLAAVGTRACPGTSPLQSTGLAHDARTDGMDMAGHDRFYGLPDDPNAQVRRVRGEHLRWHARQGATLLASDASPPLRSTPVGAWCRRRASVNISDWAALYTCNCRDAVPPESQPDPNPSGCCGCWGRAS
jgi:hypothetical protein